MNYNPCSDMPDDDNLSLVMPVALLSCLLAINVAITMQLKHARSNFYHIYRGTANAAKTM
jgi:hypothetical protein